MRMLQPRRQQHLAVEPLRIHAGGKLRVQHLDDDVTMQRDVLGEEDAGHAAPADLADNAIGRPKCGLELFGDVGVQRYLGTAGWRRRSTFRR